MHLTEEKIKKLEIKANDIRQSIIEMLVAAWRIFLRFFIFIF